MQYILCKELSVIKMHVMICIYNVLESCRGNMYVNLKLYQTPVLPPYFATGMVDGVSA